jgi:flap endonuclease-1
MGIRGLGGFIKWKLPNIRKSLKWTSYAGTRWGIDCSCLLFRARGSNLSPMTVIASLLVRMHRAGIQAVFIFDGRPPAAKSDVVDQRRVARQAIQKEMAELKEDLTQVGLTELEKATMETRHAALQKKAPTVSSGDKDELKQFLYACGVQFITAAGEADDVLAYLCRTGFLQGVVSTDMDMLARGVPILIHPETADTSVLTVIRLDEILAGLRLSMSQFVDACMLMGSDYSGKSWKPMDPMLAVQKARDGVDWTTYDETIREGVALLSGEGVKWEAIVSEKQREKWTIGPPPCELENCMAAVVKYGWPTDWASILSHPQEK